MALKWDPIRGFVEDGGTYTPDVTEPLPFYGGIVTHHAEPQKPTVDSIRSKFYDGVTEARYRYAGAWRKGVVMGSVEMGGVGYVVMKVNKPDEDVAYVASKGSKWLKIVNTLISVGSTLPVGTKLVLVAPDQIEEIAKSKKAMPERPHKCPACGGPALIMSTQISCSLWVCKHYDKYYHKDT